MISGLKNKVVIITGGTRGIGHAIAEAFLEEGATVIITGRDEFNTDIIAHNLSSKYKAEVVPYTHDVTIEESSQNLVQYVCKKFGRLDILVNNAGITADSNFMVMSEEDWSKVISTNMSGTFFCSKYAAKKMLNQKSGRIINISSIVSLSGNRGQANYSAAKAGVNSLTKTMAIELGRKGITVNAIAPGYIKTDMTVDMKKSIEEHIMLRTPLNTFGTPKNIADAVVFLASDQASYITGQILNVDGGFML